MISRRHALKLSGLAAATAVWPGLVRPAAAAPDHTLDIAPVNVELSPRHSVTTVAYNGTVPGPVLRLREGQPVTIAVNNRSARPEVVHWHGLYLPPAVDGAAEEGTPMIDPAGRAVYTFVPEPAGFRWYHTHTMAMGDLKLAQYGGQHGFLLIEPRQDPARYDREFFLALHDWQGRLLASDDGAMNPTYAVSSVNGKMLGAGEPLRVKQGERVLLHLLNSSPTEVHWLALAGHALQVVALDGNAVPAPGRVPMVRLAPAERVCAIVDMNNPGIWVLGEVRRHVQAAGMGIVVEYAGQRGAPRWNQPESLLWSYARFAAAAGAPAAPSADGRLPPVTLPLTFEPSFRGHGAMERWLINGRSYPDTRAPPLVRGQRYRLRFINKSIDDHPLHLHRHSFAVTRLGMPLDADADHGPARLSGLIKDVVLVEARTQAEVEFTADHPGATLFHCHQQNHMDLGFMLLFDYA